MLCAVHLELVPWRVHEQLPRTTKVGISDLPTWVALFSAALLQMEHVLASEKRSALLPPGHPQAGQPKPLHPIIIEACR
jgi:hypothetical protein